MVTRVVMGEAMGSDGDCWTSDGMGDVHRCMEM